MISLILVAGLFAAYVGAAHASLTVPNDSVDAELNERDAWYFALHGSGLVVGTTVGVIAGALLRRSVFALGLLFFAVLLTGMALAQVVTFELACDGRNDIVRHWQCAE